MSRLDELIKELCPDGVEYINFGSIAEYIRGVTYNKSQERNDGKKGISLLRANNITLATNTLNFDEVKIIDKSVKVKDSQYLKTGDILICAGSGSKEHIGKVAYISKNMQITFGGFMGVIRTNPSMMSSRFMFHILTSPIFKLHLAKVSNSATINNINNDTWRTFKIPVPPLEIQEEIVKILDKFTDYVTALQAELQAELQARKQQYEYYSSKLLSEADSEWIAMSELASFVYGYTDTAKDIGDARFIRITDIDDQGCLKSENPKYITLNDEARKSLLSHGDLVMARTGATYGKTLYFEDDMPSVYASFLIKIQVNNTMLDSRYYWHFTKTSLYWDQANKLVTNGGQQQFNTPAIKKVKVPVPSLEEQHRIVRTLDRFDKLCNDISIGLPAELEARQKQYEYYRDKLLTFKELEVQ